MKNNSLNFLASCAMAQDWGMEALAFVAHENGQLEMEGNYALHSSSNLDWGVLPSKKDFEIAKSMKGRKMAWPFKPVVVYDDRRNIIFEAGY